MALTNKPLGFINPLLYKMAADTAHLPAGQRAFNDIVLGNNVCPEVVGAFNPVLNTTLTTDNCLEVCSGFDTAPEWDPVTGLGSPNVGVMIAYLTNLLANSTRAANVSDPITAPVTFPTSGPAGTVLNVITSGLSSPSALVMNSTTLLVSDYFTPFTTTYNSAGVQGGLTLDNFDVGSLGVAIDKDAGLIFQGLANDSFYAVFDLPTATLLGFGSLPVIPRGIAVQPGTGDLYIASVYNSELLILYANGSVGTLSNPYFALPASLAFSPIDGTLYVGTEAGGLYGVGSLIAIDSTGDTLFVIDNTFDGAALDYVTGIAVDELGNVYAVDQGIGRVVIINSTGSVLGSIYGQGAGNSPNNAFFSGDGFVLPFNVAVDPRGYFIYVSDAAAGNVVQLSGLVPAPTGVGATLGDPQFYGFLGQSYQVHGIDGAVYSLISDASVQINGRFAFLGQKGQCVTQQSIRRMNNRTHSSADFDRRAAAPIQCWSHPGSYIGELSVRTAEGVRLVVVPGTATAGFERIEVTVDADEVGSEDELSASIELDHAGPRVWRDLTVTRLSSHHVLLQVSVFVLQLSSSDGFLNLDRVEVTDWHRLRTDSRSHGLLGQTWQNPPKATQGSVKGIEGKVDDYVQHGSDMFGTDNYYNRFKASNVD